MACRKKTIGILAFCAALLVGGVLLYRFFNKPRLNIILVTLDTTRADRLGCYGYKNGETSAFDEYAQCGVIFERAYAPSPVTLPSHATMLTGLYPPEHDLRVNGAGKLSKEIPFLPQILRKNGYDTGAFIAAAVLGSQYGLSRGFDEYNDGPPKKVHVQRHAHEPRRDGSEIVDLALDWLNGRKDKPFFCWVHLYDAHAPYDPRTDLFEDRFVDSPYDAGVTWELKQLGRLTAYLKDKNIDQNTVVIIAGDHGEGLDEHLETEHGMLVYNSTLHVPLVFVGSDVCKPGTRVTTPVSLVDVMPTVLEMLDLPALDRMSGQSILSGLQGNAVEERDCYAETETPYQINRWSPLQTVISGKWKYIQTTRPELYNLESDPGELKDLVASSVDDAERLKELLEDMQQSFVKVDAQSANLSEKDFANLRTLGYVDGGTAAASADPQPVQQLIDVKDMLPELAKFETAKHLGLEGRVEEALPLLQSIVDEKKQFPAAELLLGDCLAQSGRLADAERVYRSVLQQHPDFVRTHLTLGRVLLGQQLPEQALEQFQEFLKANPDVPTAHAEMAQVLAQLGKPAEAITEFQTAIRIAPDLVNARIALGQLLASQRRLGEAIECFTEVLRFDANNVAAHANLMILLSQSGQPLRAIEYGENAAKLAPDAFEIQFNFGMLLISQRRFADGLTHLRAAQKLRPEDANLKQQIQQIEAAIRRP